MFLFLLTITSYNWVICISNSLHKWNLTVSLVLCFRNMQTE
ncbi:unnamed protein product [Rodentolepis nana]|uniref:Uncharacterized protein n=1 Tax=Rodentolepis nana TaxID=102285 RepID=A0A3P7S6U6_RODNA|nr:unnamed protein product [Rodentolepis nana]